MLTIGKLGATKGQLQYYERQVATGMEDYYAGHGEAPGVWLGAGAHALGLASGQAVQDGAFMALARGLSPVDGSVLRPVRGASTVAAIDLTFSAPKSVSILFAIADESVTGALVAAHERAVDEALGYLEREACFTRRGHAGAERVRGDGFIAAGYRHRFSRAGDPQLHTHVVVGNLTRAEGRYTALDAHALYEHKSAAGAAYRAALRTEIRHRLPWARWQPAGRGLFEIDGVPDAVLRHFSQRREEIEQRASEIAGDQPGGLSRERMQGIALATRRPKHETLTRNGWRDDARARAAEHGLGDADLRALTTRPPADAPGLDLQLLAEQLSGPRGLTEMHNTFARRHALAEIASASCAGMSLGQLEDATDRYLADPSVVALDAPQDETRFTTGSLLACERLIVETTARRRDRRVAVVIRGRAGAATDARRPELNADQTAAVEALISSGHGVDVVTALAGTGKTTMLADLAARYRAAGYRVIGTAPTARAARELRDTAGIPAATMHALISELAHVGGFPPRTVLVIDEAGMACTRIAAAIFAHADQADTKIIAVGDPGQLASVQAGGWLAAIARRYPGPGLRHVIRQHDLTERAALEALHDGHPEDYLAHKRDAIAIHPDESEAVDAVVTRWDAARRERGTPGAVMIARDNHTRELLNQAARERLKHDGDLPPRGVRIGPREFSPGDRIIARHNDRRADIDNGTIGSIVTIGPHRIVIRLDSGRQRDLDPGYVAQHVDHAYALTAHSAQGATVTWAAVIGRPEHFTREWAYTALSRARQHTAFHLLAEPAAETRQRSEFAPREPEPTATQALARLERHMRQSEREHLAVDQQGRTALAALPTAGPRIAPSGRLGARAVASGRRVTVTR